MARSPLQGRGISDIDVDEVQRAPLEVGRRGQDQRAMVRGARPAGSPRASSRRLRDFGVLQGAVHKRIAPAYLPVAAFAYVMFYLKRHQPSGARLVEHPDWRLFFLPREGVERFLFEAHQRGLLEYHAAGSVTRLSFPATTLEEYAHVLAERAH